MVLASAMLPIPAAPKLSATESAMIRALRESFCAGLAVTPAVLRPWNRFGEWRRFMGDVISAMTTFEALTTPHSRMKPCRVLVMSGGSGLMNPSGLFSRVLTAPGQRFIIGQLGRQNANTVRAVQA